MTNRGKVWSFFRGLIIESNNFASEVKVIQGLKRIRLDAWRGKMGINDPITNRVSSKIFFNLTIDTNNFAFEVKVILGFKTA